MSAPSGTDSTPTRAREMVNSPPRAPGRSLPAVLLGGGIVALSAARALGGAGVHVWALGDARTDLVKHSRFCTAFVDLGSGDGVQDRWLSWLKSREIGDAVLLPCCDDGLELLARDRATLTDSGYLPIESDDTVVMAMLDKMKTYELARAAGIDVPRHFALDDPRELDSALRDSGVGFPCALKPLHSHLFAREFGSDQKVFVAHDHRELLAACARIAERGLEMMVTEIVPGPEDAYHAIHTYLDDDGYPLALLTKQKLRQYPVGFGMGTSHVTTRDADVERVGLQFCRGVGIVGVANPEFKLDERDGRYKLIECNHRFTMSNELLRRAGINLPLLAYDRVLGLQVEPARDYRTGVRLWSPGGDLKAVLDARRRGQMTLRRWLPGLLRPQHVAVFDAGDPGPALASVRRRLRRLVAGRSRGRSR
jgi:D-aspartate ligase